MEELAVGQETLATQESVRVRERERERERREGACLCAYYPADQRYEERAVEEEKAGGGRRRAGYAFT